MRQEPFEAPQRATEWLDGLGFGVGRCEPLQGDVSARRYFRVELKRAGGDATAILAYYPPELRNSLDLFSRTTALLAAVEVQTPRILATASQEGFMLLEDLGAETLFDRSRSDWEELDPFLQRARSIAASISRIDRATVAQLNPPLDGALLRRELDQTWDLFLAPRGLCGSGRQRRNLDRLLDEMCERLDRAPRSPSHRDFMARNLVPARAEPGLVVIDHQDLRMAPAAYDVASLLNDSLYPPEDLCLRLLSDLDEIDYHRCAAQRTLKIIGTFIRFSQAGSDRYLWLVPVTLSRCLGHLAALPEAVSVAPDLARLWRPALETERSDTMLIR